MLSPNAASGGVGRIAPPHRLRRRCSPTPPEAAWDDFRSPTFTPPAFGRRILLPRRLRRRCRPTPPPAVARGDFWPLAAICLGCGDEQKSVRTNRQTESNLPVLIPNLPISTESLPTSTHTQPKFYSYPTYFYSYPTFLYSYPTYSYHECQFFKTIVGALNYTYLHMAGEVARPKNPPTPIFPSSDFGYFGLEILETKYK